MGKPQRYKLWNIVEKYVWYDFTEQSATFDYGWVFKVLGDFFDGFPDGAL